MGKLKKKKESAFKVLSRFSGISKKEIKNIVKNITENNKLLNSCSFHIFEQINDPSLSRVYKCKNCKGTVRGMQKIWYEKGIEHSQKRDEL